MLNYIALVLLIFVALFLFYAIIVIHDIPYEIAKKRKHPHQDAIHVAGWISLLTLHVIWPFLWIWATLYREDRGWGMSRTGTLADDLKGTAASGRAGPDNNEREDQLALLTERLAELEARLEREIPRTTSE
jgi:hypothetical protein